MLHGKVAKLDNRIEKKAQGIHHKGVRVPDVVTQSCIIDIHGSS